MLTLDFNSYYTLIYQSLTCVMQDNLTAVSFKTKHKQIKRLSTKRS